MLTSHVAFIFRMALCLGLLTGCWEGISRRVVPTVLSKQGEVVLGSSEKNDFRPLGPEEKPGVGSVLRTSDGARLDLRLLPGALARVAGNSELKLEELQLTKDGNETAGGMLDRTVQVQLKRGKVTVYFQQPDGTTGKFIITTDQVVLSAKPGSLFQVEANNSRVRVTSVRGKVYAAQAKGESSTIDEGYFREWPSAQNEAISASSDSRGQSDVAEGIKTALELNDLEAERPAYLPWVDVDLTAKPRD